MSGRHFFGELRKDFRPERRACVDARKAELHVAMPLHELREVRGGGVTRKVVGEVSKANQ